MRRLLIFLLVFVLVIITIAIITKPSDQTCIDLIKDKVTSQIENSNQNAISKIGEELITDALSSYTQYAFRIEDNIVYKNIYLKGTNIKIGVGLFGTVIISNNTTEEEKQPEPDSDTQPTGVSNSVSDAPDKIFNIVQRQPTFPGDMNKYLSDHIEYPQQAKDANIQGTVYISFVVEKDGSVKHVKVLRGVNNELDDEAKRVISNMPNWMPGQQNGHAVRVKYMVPIHFILR